MLADHFIAFSHVYKAFDRPVLVDCSFHLGSGETLAVHGPRGSGKSLILQLLSGLEQPDVGEVTMCNQILDSAEIAVEMRQRQKMVMLSESAMVVESLTVAQNLLYSLNLRSDFDESNKSMVVEGILRMGNLLEARDLRPADLPIGRRRMLALAHALTAQPECILWDEPTADVDPLAARDLCELVVRLKHQLRMTMVLATNDLDLTRRLADQVIFIDHGRLVFRGPEREFHYCSDAAVQRYLRMETD